MCSGSRSMQFLIVFICLLAFTSGECPAACSGRGTCGPYDMCTCYKGYMGGDCSQRVCQFGKAHIDIPKGDLDASDEITGPEVHIAVLSQLWPQGTTEQYPKMTDSGKIQVLSNTAHEYVECSNKGDCDRLTGQCVCLPGYDGSACQRASCPGEDGLHCSGHGVCQTAQEIARSEDGNVYELWDADATMGCVCDAGYEGPGCERRKCKHGYDPMFQDPEGSRRYTNTSYVIYVRDRLANITGNYSLEFNDAHNQRWQTRPIEYGADCYDVIQALEGIPNNVIPYGSVRCAMWSHYNRIPMQDEPIHNMYSQYYGIKYTLAFPGNPGKLKPLKVLKYLDGARPSLFSGEAENSTLSSFVYPNGFMGEDTEYWVQKCLGVELTLQLQPAVMDGLNYMSEYSYLGDLTLLEARLLQKCLGDADGLAATKSASGTIGGADYDWDYGSVYNPHIIRMVEITNPKLVTSDLCPRSTDESIRNGSRTVISSSNPHVDGGRSGSKGRTCTHTDPNPGFYAALYYVPSLNRFKLMNRPARDFGPTTKFAVWTTKGHTQMVSDEAQIYTHFDHYSNTVYSINATRNYPGYEGIIGCENNAESKNGAFTCLDKGDLVFFLDKVRPDRNPEYFNIYTIAKVYVEQGAMKQQPFSKRNRIQLNYALNADYLNPNISTPDLTWKVRAYKFYPPTGYTYVSECSNRGNCDAYGQCNCFDMFTMDDCSSLNNFATSWDQ